MYATLHLPDFRLQAALRARNDLDQRPVALLTGQHRQSVVASCNALARDCGVEPGLSGPQALARCPALAFCAPLPDAEHEAYATLLAVGFSVSPAVETTAPGTITLDLSGHPAAKREALLRGALAQLQGLGLEARAGLARTPLLAFYAAQQAAPFLAVEHARTFLDPLPLVFADPPPDVLAILRNWGLRTLGDLTALSKADITQRLGPRGLALWERAAGETERPLQLTAPGRDFSARLELEHEIEALEPLLFVLRRLVDRLVLDLANAGLAAAELTLVLGCSDEQVVERSFRLPEATTQAEIVFNMLHTYLESLRAESPIAKVELRITPSRPLTRQQGLFDSALTDAHGFAETLARAVAIVGSGHVGTPQLQPSHKPDAVTLVPPAATVAEADPVNDFWLRGLSLRRFRPPAPAKVELAGCAPAFIWTEAVQGAVCAVQGPWRLSGEWWEAGREWIREEWDVELAAGGVYRVLSLPDGRWYLEGEYD